MSATSNRQYHRPTVQALGSVSDLTRANGGSGNDGDTDPMMMRVN